MGFTKATKFASKLRMAIAGPSGSGKTWTSLTLAHALANGGRVAVIDTERGSASKYADIFPEFDVQELDSFSPLNYIAAIKAAEQEGYAVLVIDSLSHAWNGPGGLLEMVETITKRSKSGSSFNAWGEATPLQNKLIDAITRAKLHIICTMRTKTEYVIEQNQNGRSAPRKVGTAPVQRADMEYEFDVYADMDVDNNLIVQKSRCPALSGQVIAKPGAQVADVLHAWLAGETAPAQPDPSPDTEEGISEQQASSIRKLCSAMNKPEPELLNALDLLGARKKIQQLTAEYKEYLSQQRQGKQAQSAPDVEVAPAAAPTPIEVLSIREIYTRGKLKDLWTNPAGFTEFLVAQFPQQDIKPDTKFTVEQRMELSALIEKAEQGEEIPVPIAS